MILKKAKTKVTPVTEEELPRFVVSIKLEGNFNENVNTDINRVIDSEFVEKLERAFETQVEQQCRKAIRKIQEDCCADAL